MPCSVISHVMLVPAHCAACDQHVDIGDTCVAVLVVEGADVGVRVARHDRRVAALLDNEVHAVRQRELADGPLQPGLQVRAAPICGVNVCQSSESSAAFKPSVPGGTSLRIRGVF